MTVSGLKIINRKNYGLNLTDRLKAQIFTKKGGEKVGDEVYTKRV